MTPLEKAIKKVKTQTALALALGVEPMTVSNWKKRGVPPGRLLSIFIATGITPHELRPDIHPTATSGIPPEMQNNHSVD